MNTEKAKRPSRRRRIEMSTYLLAGSAVIVCFPIALLLGITEFSVRDHTQTEIGRMSRAVALSAAGSVSVLLDPILNELREIAAAFDDPRISGDPRGFLYMKQKTIPFLESILVIDSRGYSCAAAPDNPMYLGHYFGDTMLFKYPRAYDAPYFTDSFLSPRTRRAAASVSAAAANGLVVVGNINMESISGLLAETTRELGAAIRVLDGRGIVMAGPDRKEVLTRTSFQDIVKAAVESNWDNGRGFRHQRNGQAFITFSSPISHSPWRTLVSFRAEEVDALPAFIRERVILGGTAALAFSVLAAFLFSREIHRPLGELLVSVRGMAQESHSAGSRPQSTFAEIDDLLREFENMQKQVYLREEELKGALAGRETLLKEIHHRVKNNLQIVASLLALQKERIENPEAYMALSESAQRVQSLSLVHEKLYQSSDFATLDLGEYLGDFCRGLLGAVNAIHYFDFEMEKESVNVDVDIAIPIGLCVNEILSNSIKYGRPAGEQRGRILLVLKQDGQGFLLQLSDNGPGFNPEAARKSGSLGLLLIDSLVAQIKGTLDIDISAGSRFTIRISRVRARS